MTAALTKALQVLAVGLVVLWTLHTVVVTGTVMLNTHYGQLMKGAPDAAPRAPLSGLIQDTTPQLTTLLPRNASVLVLVDSQEVFANFWLTYWLYPRHVDQSSDLSLASTTRDDAIVYYQQPSAPSLDPPSGYELRSDIAYTDGGHVLVYVKTGVRA